MDGRASHKRPRVDLSDSPLDPSSIYLARACLTRDEVTKYSRCAFFDKLARGHYIRATVSGSDGKPTPRLLLVRSISSTSASGSTTYTLLVNDPERNADIQLPLTSISNSQPSEKETDNLLNALRRLQDQQTSSSSRTTQASLPTPSEIDKIVSLRLRIIQDATDGRACAAPSSLKATSSLTIWGGNSTGTTAAAIIDHEAVVVFRSWLLQDVLLEQAAARGELNIKIGAESPQGVAPSLLGDSTWAEGGPLLLQPCIADGRGIDALTGASGGPCGQLQRAGGQFSYLFLHKMPLIDAKSSSNEGVLSGSDSMSTSGCLEPFSTPPAIYDEHQPDITAWRAARKYIDNSISLELFRASILAQVDHNPSIGGPSSSAGATVSTSAGFGVRCLHSPVQLFLVDIDSIARQLGQQTQQTQPSSAVDDKNFHSKQWLLKIVGNKGGVSNDQIQEMLTRTQKEISNEEGHVKIAPLYFQPEGGRTSSKASLTSESTSVVSIQRFGNGIAVLSETQLESAIGRNHSKEKAYIKGAWCDVSRLLIGNDEHSILRTLFTACYGTYELKKEADLSPLIKTSSEHGTGVEDPGILSDSIFSCLHQAPAQKHKQKLDVSQSSPPWPVYSPLVASIHTSSTSSSSSSSSHSASTALLPHGPFWVPHLFPRRFNNEHSVILYHGTSLSMAQSIQEKGFFRARCRMAESCIDGSCSCNMLGFGVYFGDKSKAIHFATRRAVFDSKSGKQVAAIVRVRVDLGLIKVSSGPCPCGRKGGCSAPFVDHWGDYHSQQGFDSLYIRAGSSGAANQREWAVSDPERCEVLGIEILDLSKESS